jgi:AraC family transcriptional regulator
MRLQRSQPKRFSRSKVRSIVQFVSENINKKFTVADMANRACLSKYHFSRVFFLQFGITPAKYVERRRIVMARRLLLSNTLTLTQVSFACGYSSASHFSTAFRKLCGMTPGQYRRNGGSPDTKSDAQAGNHPVRQKLARMRKVVGRI